MLPPGCRCRCTTAAGAAAAGVAAADDDDNAATATRPHQRRHYRRGCRLRLRSAKFSRPTHALPSPPSLRTNSTTVFSHAQTVVVCGSCSAMLCQPTGGKAKLTEGCRHRKKAD
jgi:hypothetical protein